ncbi:MAG TPA: glycosyltransferase family 2 protein [Candidatus Micrarchaeia archaeon]|nr:glycosyltransferase family 2 protein [Candidatus Micrarchaeia archaeon]
MTDDRPAVGDRVLAQSPLMAESIAVVMPAYNEEATIERAVRESLRVLSSTTRDYEVVVVDDGSSDATAAVARRLAAEDAHVRVIEIGRNIGANAAVVVGMRSSDSDLRFFVPADLQVHPDQLGACLPVMSRADYVCTRRLHRADPLHRRLMARSYNWLVRMLFDLPAHDIDSSVLLRREVVERITGELRSSSDFLPVEMLVRALGSGFRVVEVPIEHHPRSGGRPGSIVPLDVARTFVDLLRSARAMRRLRFQPARAGSPPR